MSNEIRRREKKFCLALIIVMIFAFRGVSAYVEAENYTVSSDLTIINSSDEVVEYLAGGDVVQSDSWIAASCSIFYQDKSGASLGMDSVSGNGPNSAVTFTVKQYSDFVSEGATLEINESDFYAWKVDAISQSSGQCTSITLTATEYTVWNIYYELRGGVNAASNPSTYREQAEAVPFADATKENYTFKGWYSDPDCEDANKVETTADCVLDTILYAKFEANTYDITYVLDGGENAAGNPTTFTYGVGVESFAAATKANYTFKGWYKDAELTEEVTKIEATESAAVTLYAKFKENVGKGVLEIDDIYYGDTLIVSVSSETNGTENAVVEYKERTAADTAYSVSSPMNAGDYIARVIFPANEDYKELTVTCEFSIFKAEGTGSITVADLCYGTLPSPVLKTTNSLSNVVIEYKKKGAADSTYSEEKPGAIGDYEARAVFAETKNYNEVIAYTEFSIDYLEAPENPFTISATAGKNGYYVSDVIIVPLEGYVVSDLIYGDFNSEYKLTESVGELKLYLKKLSTGEKTDAITVSPIQIDKKAPVAAYSGNSNTIYANQTDVVIEDEALSSVTVNGESVTFSNNRAVITLSSNNGKEVYEIAAMDKAGNETSLKLSVIVKWMESNEIPAGQKVKLYSNQKYSFGTGKWQVEGDDTVYSGNVSFYIDTEGEYSFSQAE